MSEQAEKPSKSQRKRDAQALQRMAQVLVELSGADLDRLQLPETLLAAVIHARQITQRGGRKRQIRYVGRLLRELDADPIARQLDHLQRRSRQAAVRFQNLERWRERLIDEGDTALSDLVEQYPHADRQRIRQLARNARQQRERDQSPESARDLFRYLRELDQARGDDNS